MSTRFRGQPEKVRQWKTFKGKKLDDAYRKWLEAQEEIAKAKLQKQIKDLLSQ